MSYLLPQSLNHLLMKEILSYICILGYVPGVDPHHLTPTTAKWSKSEITTNASPNVTPKRNVAFPYWLENMSSSQIYLSKIGAWWGFASKKNQTPAKIIVWILEHIVFFSHFEKKMFRSKLQPPICCTTTVFQDFKKFLLENDLILTKKCSKALEETLAPWSSHGSFRRGGGGLPIGALAL